MHVLRQLKNDHSAGNSLQSQGNANRVACDECLRWANAGFTVPHSGQAAESPGALDVEGGVSNRLAQKFALSGCVVAKLNNIRLAWFRSPCAAGPQTQRIDFDDEPRRKAGNPAGPRRASRIFRLKTALSLFSGDE